MKLVKIKNREELGNDFEYASKYMYRLYRPDEDGNAIYMPVNIPEETREYLEALLWTGVQTNEEICITEGADYVLGQYDSGYIRKIQHFYNPIYLINSSAESVEAELDMIMYQGGVLVYSDGIPAGFEKGVQYVTTETSGSVKIYTGREDCYILSEVLDAHLKNIDVVFTLPSKILVSMTELREVREGIDYIAEEENFRYTGEYHKIVNVLENPVYVMSARLRAVLEATDANGVYTYEGLETYVSQSGVQMYCRELPSWAVDTPDSSGNLDYTSVPVEGALKVYTSCRGIYVVSDVFAESLGDAEVLFSIPSHIEYNVEKNPEDVILNYEGAYKFPVDYEDESATYAINNTEHLEKANTAIDELDEWNPEDFTTPFMAMGDLLTRWSPEYTSKEIAWLLSNGWDDTCDVLARADAAPAKKSSCGCSSASIFDLGSTCSATEKYVNFMNAELAEKFSDIDWLHENFFIRLEGNLVRNEEMIVKFKEYLQLYKSGIANVINNTNPFCCPSVTASSSLASAIDNFCTVLDILGTPEECRKRTFIGFWGKKMIEEMLTNN